MSFSVPDQAKYQVLIEWYKGQDSQERSRNFRNIFLEYLQRPHHTMEANTQHHISREQVAPTIQRIDLARKDDELDLSGKLSSLGLRG
jgi:hypothetical protein